MFSHKCCFTAVISTTKNIVPFFHPFVKLKKAPNLAAKSTLRLPKPWLYHFSSSGKPVIINVTGNVALGKSHDLRQRRVKMNRIQELQKLGQSVWLDYIERGMLQNGELRRWVEQGLAGVTSNPTIFQQAIAKSPAYREEL